ncbi:E3 ubiquitin-protein ligase synoviolin B-like isoform X2 [Copidosoma floridanum]|uniref:E3 ubiquitin-protein ligase synoviolin B-like isoform X2 n=1 Tax=Copidosoma floridanum TaxID=29053 RepID=UPI000C6FAB11|nr:E3 ubiquitin-protein ligase synoviolin B-like isoform X2 [Copidosoma floridanum]
MRAAGIALISVALTCAVIGNAYYQKKQFYPSVVYITKSNPSMAVIYVQGLILVLMANSLLRKIFFGNLRAAEFEHLMEKLWYAVTETCLAFTVFRDDFSPKFIALFTLLLFLKSFHWLAEDRVDYMERSPVITWLFHLRIGTLLALLFSINLAMFNYAYTSTLSKGPSVQLVFGFEYALLLTVVLNINIKYILHTIDLQRDNPWDNKPVFLLYTELIIGLLKVMLYLAFVGIMMKIFTLPLFAFRPMYYTMRNFKKAFHDIVMSRRAIRNMNTMYPNATPEELAAADNVCIICREEMVSASKKLPCNHIFHTACLRSWFQRQQTCPTCRLNILRPSQSTTRQQIQAQPQPQPVQQPAPQPPPAPGPNQQPAPPFQLPPFWANFPAPPPIRTSQAASQGSSSQPQQQQPGTSSSDSSADPPLGTVGGFPVFSPSTFQTIIPMPPVPLPPLNLSALSEEELRQMEGDMRQAVEHRIETLRRVYLLMDAAIAMMGQYQTAAVTTGISVSPTKSATDESSQSSTSAKAEESPEASSSNDDASTNANTTDNSKPTNVDKAQNSIQKTVTNTPTDDVAVTLTAAAPSSPNTNNISEPVPSTSQVNELPNDQEMLRRRRLQN